MNEWSREQKKHITELFQEYGKVILVSFLSCLSLVFLCLIGSFISPQKLTVSFLDIGQGDAILIQTPSGKTMLVDGGPSDKVLEQLSREISYFHNDIDVMVSTHPDADHATGLIPVLEKYNVKKIVLSPVMGHTGIFDDLSKHIDDEHADIYIAETGDEINFHDGVVARILYPSKNYKEKKNDTNDASVSMVVTYGDETFLLTGDLPSTEESQLIDAGLQKNITVYKAGHHGSKYSSGEQLLTYIHPEYTVISAGKDNTYGHPNPETLERLQKYSKDILSTIDHGTITFSVDGRTVDIVTRK